MAVDCSNHGTEKSVHNIPVERLGVRSGFDRTPGSRSDRQLRSGRFFTDSITSSALVGQAGFAPQQDSRPAGLSMAEGIPATDLSKHAHKRGWAGVPAGFYDIPEPAHGAMDVTV